MPKQPTPTASQTLSVKQQRLFSRALEAERNGDILEARRLYEAVLRKAALHPQSNLGLARSFAAKGQADEAIEALSSALKSPRVPAVLRAARAGLYFQNNDMTAAMADYAELRGTLDCEPQATIRWAMCAEYCGRSDDAERGISAALQQSDWPLNARVELAAAARSLGFVEVAKQCLEGAQAEAPKDQHVLQQLGMCCVDVGDIEQAESCFDRVLTQDPKAADAWFQRVRLRRHTAVDTPIVERLRDALLGTYQQPMDEATLNYSLAKVQDDLGDFDAAFAHYQAANKIQHAGGRYHREGNEQALDELINAYDADLFAGRTAASESQVPVLVVGMPRSGTTLVEQILASHPAVFGAGELRDLGASVALIAGDTAYPAGIANVADSALESAAQRYLSRLRQLAGDAPLRVTDKMPTNFTELGLAALLFKGVRIVHCRRDPIDTCFSNFIQYFTEGHLYATDLDDTAHFYSLYRRIMQHWQQVLPTEILHVDYEAVIEDVEREARRVIDYVGLPWDQRCVEFHATARTMHSASNWQVRQLIYQQASQRWRHYAKHLEPLRQKLLATVPGITL
jgi:tetratricopeptide (TPR) repeat protein